MMARRMRCCGYSLFGVIPAVLTILSAFMIGLVFAPADVHPVVSTLLLWLVLLSPWIGFGSLVYVISNLGEVPRSRIPLNVVLLLIAAGGSYVQASVWLSMTDGGPWAVPAALSGIAYLLAIIELGVQRKEGAATLATE